MSTQTTPERAQAQANGSAVALASPDRRQTGRPSAPARAGRGFTRRSAAGDVVMAYVGTQAVRLKALDPLVRENAPDSVHQMRVAARRLRSTLQAYPAILPKPATQHLRAEQKWTAVFVTHSVSEAAFLANRAVVMGRGGGAIKLDRTLQLPTVRDNELRGDPRLGQEMRLLLGAIEE